MRPHQWEPKGRPRRDWGPLALALAPWLVLALFDLLGI